LYSRNPPGGLAYVTSGVTPAEPVPVVVFLHGMNAEQRMHPWFGPPFGDLRPVVESLVAASTVTPLVVAAPTHTRFATGATVMWPAFDLGEFLDATEHALLGRATLDRARIVVVGHSGAGCNPTGGLLSERVRDAHPRAVIDIDGCVGAAVVDSLVATSQASDVYFFWQRSWGRPIANLEAACALCNVEQITDLEPGIVPHIAIVPNVLRRILPKVFPLVSGILGDSSASPRNDKTGPK
jgi:hypothetical protein